VAQSLGNLADLYSDQRKPKEAESLYLRSLEIRQKVLGSQHPDTITTLDNLATLYTAQRRYLEAEMLYRRTVAAWGKILGPEHPEVATNLNNLAMLYYAQANYRDAEPLFQRALAIREKALGPEHLDVAISLNNLALVYQAQGKYSDAEPLYKRSLEILERAAGLPLRVATVLTNYAALLKKTGRGTEAKEMKARAKTIRERHGRADRRRSNEAYRLGSRATEELRLPRCSKDSIFFNEHKLLARGAAIGAFVGGILGDQGVAAFQALPDQVQEHRKLTRKVRGSQSTV